MQTVLPTGTLTFLFTDVEGSTGHWESEPQRMRDVLARHDALVRAVLERHEGVVFKTVGDAFYSTFDDPARAVAAAADVQIALAASDWSPLSDLRVRIALHTGTAQQREGDYLWAGPQPRVTRARCSLRRTDRSLGIHRAARAR
ncbi:MAG: hypothetical protein M3Y18_05595 [Candidatus Eremiobacteraeota bacterium]|nr:hypothetical protein [Candidatus Eremiobacteraeota bacterium]